MSEQNSATQAADDGKAIIKAFYEACRSRRVPRKAVLAWPELGERLPNYVYGGQLEQLQTAAARLTPDRRAQLLQDLPAIASFSPAAEPAILTVGTANAAS